MSRLLALRLITILAVFSTVDAMPAAERVRIRGIVTNQGGAAVAGARVQTFPSVLTADLQAKMAVTDADGAFTIEAAADHNETFLIEAPGYAPALASVDQFGEQTNKTVVLKRGATLAVRFEVLPLHQVSLVPIDAELPPGLSRQRAIRVWTRRVRELEERWTSLPIGTYQIVLLPAGRPPVEIGEVVLARGADESAAVGNSEHVALSERRIDIHTDPEASAIAETLSITEWRYGAPKQLQVNERKSGPTRVLSAATECVAGSILVASSETFIGSEILDGKCADPIRIRLEQRVSVSVRLRIPAGAAMPVHVVLRAAQCQAGAALEIPALVRDGRIHSGVPARCRVLSLHSADFAPVRIALRPLQSGASQDLGSVSLQLGAAAVLRIRSRRTGEPLHGVKVACVRTSDVAAMQPELAIDSVAVGTAVTDADGWARITVPAAERLVFFLHAQGRRRPQMSQEYEFATGEEMYVDDLHVEPVTNVLVMLSVPRSLEAVEWQQIELEAAGQSRWPSPVPLRASVAPAGTFLDDVPPGMYRIFAAGRLRNGFAVRLGEKTVDIAPGVDQSVTLEITGSVYSGKLTRRGIGVQGTINITPAKPNRQPAVAKTNTEGEFQVLLGGPGNYRVRVQTMGRQSIVLGGEIEFTDPDEEVRIDVPAGEIRGRVVDRAGRGIPGMFAGGLRQGLAPQAEVSALTTDDGSFALVGVTSGTWSVHATSATHRSTESIVTVADGDAGEVSLVAEPLHTVTIRVMDPAGLPVRSVEVEFDLPRPGRPDDAPLRRDITRASGEVRFPLLESEQSSPVNIILTGTDGRLSCAVRTLNADQIITLTPQLGAVRLVGAPKGRSIGGRPWLVSSSGCAVPFYARAEREPSGEPATVFSRLPAGQWTYVRSHSTREHAAVLTGRALSLPAIATFRVEAGNTTRVLLD